ncbi:MAG: signal transduction histidine kinase/ActR/RegA family two-component response regulator [Desulforhopalus sp.]|jgi:signal transduction histidine kinase/ActR/RegA family two-component response regulator
MNRQKLHSRIPMYSLVILTLIFCFFSLGFEKYAADSAQARLVKHAMIVADDLWNFNSEGAVEYLKLAAEKDHYATLEVTNNNGELFQSITTTFPNTFEKFLIGLHLIPRVMLITPVQSNTNIIGWVEAIWIPHTLFVQFYALSFLFMLHLTIMLYCRISQEKLLLEERVVERTNELAESNRILQLEYQERYQAEKERGKIQKQLEQSKKMESLGLLAGGVAHDLNNVLSGIVSYPDLLLLDLPSDSPQRKTIETIRSSGLRAADIIQDLLTLARRGVVTKQLIDLNELIREYSHSPEYDKLLDYHPNIEVIFNMEEPLATTMGSPTALKKVIMNLVSNGAEAQPQGGSISITSRNQYLETTLNVFKPIAAGNYVVLEVRDEGEGIDPEDMQRIFEPFYTKKVMGRSGTGLGLTVVWGTIEDHDGTIDIGSTPGAGTTIEIYLPVSTDIAATSEEEITPTELFGNYQTILVVDDVAHQREIASAILTRMHYQVNAVASGEEAIVFLMEKKVDLVVLDMILDGGMDGLETYKRIIKLHPGQKAIIASGFSETDQVQEAQELGAGSCIRKPYTLQQLSDAVWNELAPSKGDSCH